MKPTARAYRALSDFMPVYAFLQDCFELGAFNGYYLPPFFEYAHTHCCFNKNMTHRMSVWEDGGKIVAFCGYEMDLGEAYLVTARGCESLLPELLNRAERELSVESGGARSLEVWITAAQAVHAELLESCGYEKAYAEPIKIYRYDNGFKGCKLPKGFECVPLAQASNLEKLNRCTYRGFNHGDEVEYDLDGMRGMAGGPHFHPELGRVVVAPDGEYACYAGMWLDEKNHYAYLEPLCTQPEYRRMGLAGFALTDAMMNTRALGAKFCFGGVDRFYTSLGFETAGERQMWKKTWQAPPQDAL